MADQQSMAQVDVEEEYSEPTPTRDELARISILQWVLLIGAIGYGAANVGLSSGLAGPLGGAVGAGVVVFVAILVYNR